MTPTHIQIAEWREKFESGFQYKPTIDDDGDYLDNTQVMWTGYIRARIEQTAQIAELKAKLTTAASAIQEAYSFQSSGTSPSIHDYGRWRRIEATITKLLKD